MLQMLMSYLNEFLGVAVTSLAGLAYVQFKKHIHLKIKKEYAQLAIRFASQVFSDLDGKGKFDKACEWMVEQLGHLKIKTNKNEVKGILEGEYNFIKQTAVKEVTKEQVPQPLAK